MSSKTYDVAVIGGGVVGCAVLFELTRQGFKCVLLEKNTSLMAEASAGNSGMLHTGFDAPSNSLELKCIRKSQEMVHDVIQAFNLPYRKCGAHVIAWNDDQKAEISRVIQGSEFNGLGSEVNEVSASDVYQAEPYLRPGVKRALFIPSEAVLDSGLLGICLAHHAREQNAEVYTSCGVQGISQGVLKTDKGPITAKSIISCTGLFGDVVDGYVEAQSFSIKARKGQYCVYGRSNQHLVQSIILPTPTEKTKGVAVFKSVYDNVIVGPTAEDVPGRSCRPLFDGAIHEALRATASQTIPELEDVMPIGAYTGARPATEFKDYQIKSFPSKSFISVGGIRSTGVSGCLGIASHVAEKLREELCVEPSGGSSRQLEELVWQVNDDRHSVTARRGPQDWNRISHSTRYETNHPIFLYGRQDG